MVVVSLAKLPLYDYHWTSQITSQRKFSCLVWGELISRHPALVSQGWACETRQSQQISLWRESVWKGSLYWNRDKVLQLHPTSSSSIEILSKLSLISSLISPTLCALPSSHGRPICCVPCHSNQQLPLTWWKSITHPCQQPRMPAGFALLELSWTSELRCTFIAIGWCVWREFLTSCPNWAMATWDKLPDTPRDRQDTGVPRGQEDFIAQWGQYKHSNYNDTLHWHAGITSLHRKVC